MPTYVPYVVNNGGAQVTLGHYKTAQLSGAIVATPTALDVHGRLRWAPTLTTAFCGLVRCRIGWDCLTAITAAVRNAYQLSIARGFTVDFTTAITNANMAAVAKTNQMRGTMAPSQMGTSGPGICTTAPCTGMTYTLDANPFCYANLPQLVGTNSVGTAIALSLGMSTPMNTLYEWTGIGDHPPILSNQEGIACQLVHTGHATGTTSIKLEWGWFECLAF